MCLMHCLLEMVDTQKECTNSPTGIVIDASFPIQILKPGTSATIGVFIQGVIIPFLKWSSAHIQKGGYHL